MEKVSIASLLEAGSHFGHQTKKWNPKMKSYILRRRGDIHIIDLKKTLYAMDEAFSFVSDLAKKGGTILFVGTKKQAQDAVMEQATRCSMPYVNSRWLGGMLTNFNTIRNSVKRMEQLELQESEGILATLTKKEQILLKKEMVKLQTNLNGIRNMKRTPDAVFVVDTTKEEIAVKEALKLGIPIIGTVDTNSDPDLIDYGIPINDDAIRSVELVVEFMAEAVLAGVGAVTEEEMLKEKKAKEEEAKAKELVEKEAQTLDEIMSDDKQEEEEK
ncbi:MAG: 30S ribosomal protein S2 [Coriobacteriia bacterium]|nr:30S ribosomal protein S2 [Coriobacteriia bacterium]